MIHLHSQILFFLNFFKKKKIISLKKIEIKIHIAGIGDTLSYFPSIHTPVYTCATTSLPNNNTDNDNKFKRAKTSPILGSCLPQNLQPQIKSFSVAYFVIIYSVDGIYCICIWSLICPGESNTAGLYRNVRVSSLEGERGGQPLTTSRCLCISCVGWRPGL